MYIYIHIWGLLDDSEGHASEHFTACNVRDLSLISGSGRSPGEGTGKSFQNSCLENPMDGGAWQASGYRVTKSRKKLRDFTLYTYMHDIYFKRKQWIAS